MKAMNLHSIIIKILFNEFLKFSSVYMIALEELLKKALPRIPSVKILNQFHNSASLSKYSHLNKYFLSFPTQTTTERKNSFIRSTRRQLPPHLLPSRVNEQPFHPYLRQAQHPFP